MINISKILCHSSLLGETSFQLCFACIRMTARFSFVEKSELFELITVLAPELPRGPCWNPCVTGGKRKKIPSISAAKRFRVIVRGPNRLHVFGRVRTLFQGRRKSTGVFLRLHSESDARSFINRRSLLLAAFAARWRCPSPPRFSSPT